MTAVSLSLGPDVLGSRGYDLMGQLGRGQYGTAYLVQRQGDQAADGGASDPRVAKIVLLNHLKENDRRLSLQEAELLRKLSHPNVVRHYESFLHVGDGQELLVTIMEYGAGGDLHAWLEILQKGDDILTESLVLTLFAQLLLGIRYVHSQRILHRDLKSSNLLLDSTRQVLKIGDFGIARVLNFTSDAAMTSLGTPYYMSPEVCKGEAYSQKSDMWSLGCVLFELCTFERPFESQNLLGLVYSIVMDNYRPIPEGRYSLAMGDLIARLLAKEADQRPSASEALQLEVLRPHAARCAERLPDDQQQVPVAVAAPIAPGNPLQHGLVDPNATPAPLVEQPASTEGIRGWVIDSMAGSGGGSNKGAAQKLPTITSCHSFDDDDDSAADFKLLGDAGDDDSSVAESVLEGFDPSDPLGASGPIEAV